MWSRVSRKDNPVGYFQFLVNKELAQESKEIDAMDDGLEDRFLALFDGRDWLPADKISGLMPDMDFETRKALKDRLLAEGKIKHDPVVRPNSATC